MLSSLTSIVLLSVSSCNSLNFSSKDLDAISLGAYVFGIDITSLSKVPFSRILFPSLSLLNRFNFSFALSEIRTATPALFYFS